MDFLNRHAAWSREDWEQAFRRQPHGGRTSLLIQSTNGVTAYCDGPGRLISTAAPAYGLDSMLQRAISRRLSVLGSRDHLHTIFALYTDLIAFAMLQKINKRFLDDIECQ